MRNDEVFNSSNICVNPVADKIWFVDWMVIVEQIHLSVIIVLLNIRQNFQLKKLSISFSVSALQNVEFSQSMKTETLTKL